MRFEALEPALGPSGSPFLTFETWPFPTGTDADTLEVLEGDERGEGVTEERSGRGGRIDTARDFWLRGQLHINNGRFRQFERTVSLGLVLAIAEEVLNASVPARYGDAAAHRSGGPTGATLAENIDDEVAVRA